MKSDLPVVLVLLTLTAGACSEPASPPRRPNVLLVCLDTVRADHLGSYGYARPTTPSLDALAARALVFEDASATAGWTKPSVPSFLTGTYPCQHGVYEGSAHEGGTEVTDVLPEGSFTLAEAFQQQGYRTAAFVHNAQLRAGNGFEQGFASYVEGTMDAREIRWSGLDWLDRAGEAERAQPFFLYLHFLEAHWPYAAPEAWTSRFAPLAETERFRGSDARVLLAAINDGARALTDADRAALVALYDGALAYVDAELGHLLAGLELRGLAEDTIVCVVADHGEEFGEHGKVGHGHGLWENLLRVPWILRVPGAAPGRVPTPVSLIDLFPTLLAAARLPVPPGLEGVDRRAEPAVARPILAEHKAPDRYLQSLRESTGKLQRSFTPPFAPTPGELLLPLSVGTRWKAELEVRGDELVARRLEPRDEPPTELPELKGPIEGLGTDEFRIAGIRVRYDEHARRQVEPGTSGPELANGLVVKVRGQLVERVMRAERIRFYAPTERTDPELRAAVEALDQAGDVAHVTMAGFVLTVTPATGFGGVEHRPKATLARETMATLLESEPGWAAARGWEIRRELFDLAADAAELAPRPAEANARLEAELDALGKRLVRQRVFGARDQKALDPAALQELRAIGYGGEGR